MINFILKLTELVKEVIIFTSIEFCIQDSKITEVIVLKKLKITETVLRDGHQSLIATKLKTDEILPILEKMDRVGYYSLEVWGGATFDACIRFLNEDPWERLRQIRKRVKNTKLQMLLRGQNLLGYRHYADDVVDKFIEKSIENGIDIMKNMS